MKNDITTNVNSAFKYPPKVLIKARKCTPILFTQVSGK